MHTSNQIKQLLNKFQIKFDSFEYLGDYHSETDMQIAQLRLDGSLFIFYAEDFCPKTVHELYDYMDSFGYRDIKLVKAVTSAEQQYQTIYEPSKIANNFTAIASNPNLLDSIQPAKLTKSPIDSEWHKYVVIDGDYGTFLFTASTPAN